MLDQEIMEIFYICVAVFMFAIEIVDTNSFIDNKEYLNGKK